MTKQRSDGRPLPPYRWWQASSRSLFHLPLSRLGESPETWSIDVRRGGDSDGEMRARLYRDGVYRATSKLPAAFAVPGGSIEVAASMFGLKRCHYVMYDGTVRQLVPDPASAEGRRASLERNHPAASRAIGITSAIVLTVALVLGAPQILEQITQIPLIADTVGTFANPLRLPPSVNIVLLVATLAASTERAFRLRYNRILDGGIFDDGD
ncbi:hypothetical protein [Homoserinimonas hongtaonis]|uniref:Uncharacterized protein n=1 Tax=Homoserinimonas hongtaonis TaxID=2079791 RepID=A0A2U1SY09_9MICO|nr:hypothetical protein [Salinibacterium hongtaonis]AWB89030.1 hypothetical protein C2138_05275 [Salinibacterium hongtaonis]PWB96478.1 hypothetical protein DF220_00425 [Salinibacterium hongtaonis]